MARFARIDSEIRAIQADSRELFQGSRVEPFFCESRLKGAKNCESRVEAIRAFARTL